MDQKNEDIFDITILGGGPTGLFAAFYAGMRNATCKIIDSMPALGGRLTAVYPEKYIYDVGGFPKILARELVDNLVEQIRPYQPRICLNETALSLEQRTDGVWKLQTNEGTHLTKTLIISAGVGAYTPKKHSAPGATKFEENSIFYAVIDKFAFRNKHVVVVGGGDSALDWANELVSIASSVTLIHRTDKLRAHDASIIKLRASSAQILLNTEVVDFSGDDVLQHVVVQNNETHEFNTLKADAAVVMFGFHSSLGKIQEWGLELTKNGICVNEKMETNLNGIFAAGDIAKYGAKLDLIATGFSEAAIAVAFAKVYLNPKEKAQPLHSTTVMELKQKKIAASQNS